MYKVFVNDCLIILTENKNISTKLETINFEDFDVLQFVENCLNLNNKEICVVCTNLKVAWKQFKSNFKIEKAAGGKVINKSNEVLFIHRFNKWDLPKGKLEKFETIEECALREVEEECGVNSLSIQNQLDTTFHIFKRNDKTILKITYWFLMNTTYSGVLKPQLEEGITNVEFKDEMAVEEALKNTYRNIELLF
jgi:ADP-ribose pyrophosphatase YjhB (NUDIX family)